MFVDDLAKEADPTMRYRLNRSTSPSASDVYQAKPVVNFNAVKAAAKFSH